MSLLQRVPRVVPPADPAPTPVTVTATVTTLAAPPTPAPPPIPDPPVLQQKEQAVDELVHLKILQSLLEDSPLPLPPLAELNPSNRPTLVFVTGDANASEYNPEGFLGCAKKALIRGWDVEVVSFGSGLSDRWASMMGASRVGKKGSGALRVVDLEGWGEELVA